MVFKYNTATLKIGNASRKWTIRHKGGEKDVEKRKT